MRERNNEPPAVKIGCLRSTTNRRGVDVCPAAMNVICGVCLWWDVWQTRHDARLHSKSYSFKTKNK